MHFDHAQTPVSRLVALILLTASGLIPGTVQAQGTVQHKLPIVQVKVGPHMVRAELADTDLSRQIGLMNRKSLAPNHGMLFIFQHSQTQCMWMKNTLIDLDVAFADEEGRILNIERMRAGTTDIHCSKGNAKTALEMNRNWFAEKEVQAGQFIQLQDNGKAGR
ncbi:MAG TPA: DUF192 domain-containing protein [Limnobacter sp.]|nr:DUF192 domain-containing protein [Limnobacter sp.]